MYANTDFLIDLITILGICAFALSAVLAAREKKADLFTVIVLGIVTAVGGGTVRDCILGVPMFWAEHTYFIWVAIVSSTIGFFFVPLLEKRFINKTNLYIDSIALAMFSIQATDKAWSLDFGLPIAPILMGVMTGVGGGVIRDVLIQRPSLLLNKELYATPVALGCIIHASVLYFAPELSDVSTLVAIGLIIYLRHLSISKQLQVPGWAILK
ncbi:trimeric intracellular cation channel family protein [Shewanella japonica]|uniref:trimeric intracellular cation channel family protein n=1 Tax=Shewanella japonica TaxID=93973 RepID=UPI002494D6D3|nr:TRIC cation channel family protein [Shewanella japonica]